MENSSVKARVTATSQSSQSTHTVRFLGTPMNQDDGHRIERVSTCLIAARFRCCPQNTELEGAGFLGLPLVFTLFLLVRGVMRESLVGRRGSDSLGHSLCDC